MAGEPKKGFVPNSSDTNPPLPFVLIVFPLKNIRYKIQVFRHLFDLSVHLNVIPGPSRLVVDQLNKTVTYTLAF